jgi:hypothetical protein
MLLSAQPLINVVDANTYTITGQIQMTQGDSGTVYFRLVDLSKDKSDCGSHPSGRRYIPEAGASLVVTFDSVDCDKKLIRVATTPFVADQSIWSVPILPTDNLNGTINIKLTLLESNKATYAYITAFMEVSSMRGMIR